MSRPTTKRWQLRLRWLTCAGFLQSTTAASAGSGGLDVHWDAPPSACPSEPEVLGKLDSLLRASKKRDSVRYTIILRVRKEQAAWNLKLWSVAQEATLYRTVEADDCETLAELGVTITAFLVDPEVLDSLSEEKRSVVDGVQSADEEGEVPDPPMVFGSSNDQSTLPAERERKRSPAEPDQAHPPAHVAQKPMEPSRTWSLHSAGGISAGSLPKPSPVLRLGATRSWGHWRLSAQLHGELPQSRTLSDGPAQVRLGLAASSVAGCIGGRSGWFLGRGCAVAEGGTLLARGVGLTDGRTDVGIWAAMGVSGRMGLSLNDSWNIYLETEVLAPLVRSRVSVLGYGRVHQPGWVVFRPQLGLEWTLPSGDR